MFRLIKLAIYGLLGYAIYEFIRGMTQGETSGQAAGPGRSAGSGSRDLNEALNSGSSRENLTGPGVGQEVRTIEPSGESVSHRVGRGVVHK
jgi:hypothetical protein